MPSAISLKNVFKFFSIDISRPSTFTALKKLISKNGHYTRTFYALKDITVEIEKGENVGLIGNSGAGKTTLLKTISGLHKPDSGEVSIKGELNFLAGFGIGMVDELSVSENIYLYGAIYGLDRYKIHEKFDEIIEWAELQNFIGAKLKTLSTGMRTRLAFSITRYIDADIFLLDEALSAGDKTFREKCERVFDDYKKSGKTFIISTHNMEFVKKFCSKTLWLHKGEQMDYGDTGYVLAKYLQMEITKETTINTD
jgi:ABC-type polysaccharide/polyol phosphate transport system ATPase subunit